MFGDFFTDTCLSVDSSLVTVASNTTENLLNPSLRAVVCTVASAWVRHPEARGENKLVNCSVRVHHNCTSAEGAADAQTLKRHFFPNPPEWRLAPGESEVLSGPGARNSKQVWDQREEGWAAQNLSCSPVWGTHRSEVMGKALRAPSVSSWFFLFLVTLSETQQPSSKKT